MLHCEKVSYVTLGDCVSHIYVSHVAEWPLQTFIIPTKDDTVRVVRDFWEINKRIESALVYKDLKASHMPQLLI